MTIIDKFMYYNNEYLFINYISIKLNKYLNVWKNYLPKTYDNYII